MEIMEMTALELAEKIKTGQVSVKEADDSDKESIREYIDLFTKKFGGDPDVLLNSKFYKLTPNTSNPYKQLYVNN